MKPFPIQILQAFVLYLGHIENAKYNNIGDLHGLRNWVEYGLKQSKNELGWADFRVTDYCQIQKWWKS